MIAQKNYSSNWNLLWCPSSTFWNSLVDKASITSTEPKQPGECFSLDPPSCPAVKNLNLPLSFNLHRQTLPRWRWKMLKQSFAFPGKNKKLKSHTMFAVIMCSAEKNEAHNKTFCCSRIFRCFGFKWLGWSLTPGAPQIAYEKSMIRLWANVTVVRSLPCCLLYTCNSGTLAFKSKERKRLKQHNNLVFYFGED